MKVRFSMNEKTTLADLLQLNLHEFEDEVLEIVDKSVKEMGMEKVGCIVHVLVITTCGKLLALQFFL